MHDGVGACISLLLTSKAEAFLNHMHQTGVIDKVTGLRQVGVLPAAGT